MTRDPRDANKKKKKTWQRLIKIVKVDESTVYIILREKKIV